MKPSSILVPLVLAAAVVLAAPQSVRVVDSVAVSAPGDEAAHGFAGADAPNGEAAGLKWRSATGWFSYSLKIYDDSPLAIVLLVAAGDGGREAFDLLVDGTRVAAVTRSADQQTGGPIRFDVPFALTSGKIAVTVKLQAHPGARTPRVAEVRTVQEHLE
jgi:hypothetical protein